MRITLSIMVDSVSACGKPLEALLRLLESYELKASFFVATGVDRTLPYLQRIGKRGHIDKEMISLRAITDAGHDVGMSSYDPVAWVKKAAYADASWTREQWQRGIDAWSSLYGDLPAMHAATGYQVHPVLFACEQASGMLCASDTRGQTPYYPVMQDVSSSVMQLPVTVASAEEMMRVSPGCVTHIHQELFDASLKILPQGQHWRIVAGRDDIELVEKLIVMWRGTSKEFVSLKHLADEFAGHDLVQKHQVGWRESGQACYTATQSLPLEES